MTSKDWTDNQYIDFYMKYIKEEYRDEFVNDDENEPYIKFNAKEFEDFSRYIMSKVLQKKKDNVIKVRQDGGKHG